MDSIVQRKAFSEVLEILKYVTKTDYEKIPIEIIEVLEDNCLTDYEVKYTPKKTLDEQPILHETKIIIALFFRDYWATEEQRNKILKKEEYDLSILEEEKRKIYDPDNIFKAKETKSSIENTNLPIEIKKESFVKKILFLLKKILHIK